MPQQFSAESHQEDAMNFTFPYSGMFYNLPEGQSRPTSGEANGGSHDHHSLTSIDGSRRDILHPSNCGVDPTVLHERHPSSAVGPSQFQHLNALVAVADIPHQDPPRAGSSAAEAEGNSITETSRNPYNSRSNLLPLAPSPSRIVRPRLSTQLRSHASGSTADRSDPHHTFHFSSSVGVPGGHHNATSVVERPRRRHASRRLSPSSMPAPATSASPRFHPYAPSGASIEAMHGQSLLASLSPPEPVGLQSTPPQDGHPKLTRQEYASRSKLLRKEDWFKNQKEEPPVTAADIFVKRDYISTTDKTRFSAFVWIDPKVRRAGCRIPHDIMVKGNSVPCGYEKANAKEAIAHVSEYFCYKGYQCQSTEPGHPNPCPKWFPTRERRNDHQSKANKSPDPRINCALCDKSTLGRNMERHERGCKGRKETESQPK